MATCYLQVQKQVGFVNFADWQLCGSQFMLKHHHMAGLLRSKALKICTVQHNECHLGNPSETAASFQFTFKKIKG